MAQDAPFSAHITSSSTISTWAELIAMINYNNIIVRLKSRKFYKYIFWFLFELAVANSYVLTRYIPSTGHHHCHFVDYRLELAKQLIGDYNSRKRRGRPSTTISPQPLVSVHHFPMKAPTRSKCQRFSKRKVLKWTQWRCQACEKYFCHTGLPESDCFLLSHS